MKKTTIQKATIFQRYQALPRLRKASLWLIISLLVYTLVGFFVIPPLTKSILQKKITRHLGRSCSIGKIELNPFTLQTVVENFSLKQKSNNKQEFIGFKRLAVNFELISLWKRALIIKSIVLSAPSISCRRNNDLTYSFSDLLPVGTAPVRKTKAARPFLFSINNIQINNGTVYFDDLPKHKLHKITNLVLAVPRISNLPYRISSYIQPDFAATVNGTKFTLHGLTKPFASSRETNIEIGIKGIDIPAYLAYITSPAEIRLTSALLDINGRLTYSDENSATPRLSFSGVLDLRQVVVADKKKTPYLKIPRMLVQTGPSNLLAKEINIVKLTIDKPQLTLRRLQDGKIAPLYFVRSNKTRPEGTGQHIPSSKPPLQLKIRNFALHGGTIRFSDETASSFTTTIKPLELVVKNFSTIPGHKMSFRMSAETEAAEQITARGEAGLYPLRASANISLKDINLVKYEPYSQQFIIPQVTGGRLDFSTTGSFAHNKRGGKTRFTDINFELRHLRLRDKHGTLLLLPDLVIRHSSVGLDDREAHIGELEARDLSLHIFKEKNGGLNIRRFIKSSSSALELTSQRLKKANQLKVADPAENPWRISLDKAALSNAALTFTDNSLKLPATMTADKISFILSGLTSLSQKAKLRFSMRVNRGGGLRGSGSVVLKPLALSLDLKAGKLSLTPLQPYINKRLNLVVTNGELNVKGLLSLRQKGDKIPACFVGGWNIANFAAIDTDRGKKLIKWSSLDFTGFKYNSAPLALNVDTIIIKKLFSRIERKPDGSLNWSALLIHGPSSEASGPPPESPALAIGRVVLNQAALEFSDLDIKPSYDAVINDISGTINGLSSAPDSLAEVNISGKINRHSPMDISGRINPFKKPFYANLNLNFHDIDLSPASPYTSRHIGYATRKGKLTLKLHYLIDKQKIDADNKIFLDQFTLGKKVDSPDAVNLPIRLALALLKNRQGEITLNIPVEGSLNDPEFSVSGVVVKVIFNIITKAVTSPFALLGALIPDGEDLKYIIFSPGSAELSGIADKQLAAIAKVLYERPGLQMDVVGMATLGQDSKELNSRSFTRLLKLEKARREKTSLVKGQSAGLQDIAIAPDEYPRYLKMAYDSMQERLHPRSKGEKAWGVIKGMFSNKPKITLKKMAKAIRANIAVNDDDLRLLAHKRAEAVVNYLVNKKGVKPDRLFIIEPQLPLSGDKKKGTGMQVELVIK